MYSISTSASDFVPAGVCGRMAPRPVRRREGGEGQPSDYRSSLRAPSVRKSAPENGSGWQTGRLARPSPDRIVVRQVVRGDRLPAARHDPRVLHRVRQLPHVARATVVHSAASAALPVSANGPPFSTGRFACSRQQVTAPTPGCPRFRSRSGGMMDVEHVQPEQQILAELALGHHLPQVAVGRGKSLARRRDDRLVRPDRRESRPLPGSGAASPGCSCRVRRVRRGRACRRWRPRTCPCGPCPRR